MLIAKKYKLQKIVTDILNSCSKKNIGLHTNWVPRTENKHADFLSRHTDPDDWSIEKNVFHDLSCIFGPFTVDRFSTHYNAQSSRFNSRIWSPGSKLRQNVEKVVESSSVGENNVLRSLAGKVALYIVDSKSENTSKKYLRRFNRWKSFINEHGFSDLPAEPVHVALYLTLLIDKHSSPSVLQSVIYSIKWAHELNGYIDPTSNSFITFLLKSDKRRNGKPVVKKDPVDNIMLRELCSIYQDSSDSLVIGDLTIILIAYAVFLRFDE
ncbi:Hypothetical predicted protein [Mytilus galloprovincialis]|uniref:Core-binding (CB) domain-containing protein n=1 Tax=Mytilus galloprovincialis TaxID=29158 RepID=A0A8B6GTV7_MYTGA|nr:Hypothetical predicted protein [Mytilus galloprovincialis]